MFRVDAQLVALPTRFPQFARLIAVGINFSANTARQFQPKSSPCSTPIVLLTASFGGDDLNSGGEVSEIDCSVATVSMLAPRTALSAECLFTLISQRIIFETGGMGALHHDRGLRWLWWGFSHAWWPIGKRATAWRSIPCACPLLSMTAPNPAIIAALSMQ